jgi:tRNA(fMet)-specific endonuclease VapC
MIRYLMDTDHLTLYERRHPPLLQRLTVHPPDSIATSIVTAEELLRGRLARLSRRLDGPARIQPYAFLQLTMEFLRQIPILPFDQSCEQHFQQLLSLRLRTGTQDLKIAAIALASGLIVVTRNNRDFGQVPGLTVEDWSGP